MDLWDDDDDLLLEEEKNPYLEDEQKGLALIAKLLSNDKKNINKQRNIRKLDYLLDRKLLETSGKVSLSNEIELYDRLIQLSDKLFEQHKLQLLKNKTVVGIGGKFSAGKSKFINAVLGSDLLPEDQSPTTSIPTYLVRKQWMSVQAYTYNDQDITLDMEAAQALTHAFYQKYKIGFSQFINNLVMNVPDFRYQNIAILDTPGYNKADSSVKRSVSDAEKAYHQLKTVDYMIWLVDIENGIIQQPDLDFIRSIKAKNPILVVFNKADKKTDREIHAIVARSRDILYRSGLPIYDVVAYSALEREEYGGTDRLRQFLDRADRDVNRNEDIARQIKEIHKIITRQLGAERKRMIDRRNEIGQVIFQSESVMEIQTLVKLYSEVIRDIRNIDEYANAVEMVQKDINKLLASISN
ncbi:dynamin family protein [Paenibacillus sp. GCM10023250]|uniref:dynamin family protein n=1 Tax=Paenibacillus sp. GCM10023250 TaxID=3252648 RepID=UPI00361C3C7A